MTSSKIGAVAGCVAVVLLAAVNASATAPNVTFTATGTFGSPTSGNDTLKLANEPFTINIVANAASAPIQHGGNWALLSPFNMTGTVHSGLIGSTPVTVASPAASIEQAMGPDYDLFITGFPLKVVGISLTVKANITLPAGTLTTPLIHPFASVALSPGNATVTYSDGSDTTTLPVEQGSLVAAIPAASAAQAAVSPAGITLHAGGVRVATAHPDGTVAESPLRAGPVALGAPGDRVILKFYTSGLPDAADVQVRLGGVEVPVLYAGPAGYDPGLGEVMVEVPRSMAGTGDTEVVVTSGGQASNPVHIRIS